MMINIIIKLFQENCFLSFFLTQLQNLAFPEKKKENLSSPCIWPVAHLQVWSFNL